jgi:hypothetical protein
MSLTANSKPPTSTLFDADLDVLEAFEPPEMLDDPTPWNGTDAIESLGAAPITALAKQPMSLESLITVMFSRLLKRAESDEQREQIFSLLNGVLDAYTKSAENVCRSIGQD